MSETPVTDKHAFVYKGEMMIYAYYARCIESALTRLVSAIKEEREAAAGLGACEPGSAGDVTWGKAVDNLDAAVKAAEELGHAQ